MIHEKRRKEVKNNNAGAEEEESTGPIVWELAIGPVWF